MSEVRVGEDLTNFKIHQSQLFAIEYYEEEPKGKGTEDYVEWMLSHFTGVLLKPECGSPMDKSGIDFLIRGNGITLGLQVKSSSKGVEHFLSKGNLSKEIILLWVNTQDRTSRRKLLFLLAPILQSNGISIKEELKNLLNKVKTFKEKGLNSLPVQRGGYPGFSVKEVKSLEHLGLAYRKGGELHFV